MKKRILTLAATLLSVLQLSAGNSVRVTSPDRKIAMTFCTEKGQLQYRLEFRNKEIITTSSCGLHTEKGFVGSDVRLGKAVYRKGCEEYDLVVGKKSKVSSPWCEALVPLTDGGGNGLSVSLQIRVFDDAAAYRLIFKSNNAADGTIRIANERMDLNPVGNPTATTMFFDSFINTHEAPYVRKHIDSLDEDRLMDLPVHFEFPDGTNLAFTEADVRSMQECTLSARTAGLRAVCLQDWMTRDTASFSKREGELPGECSWWPTGLVPLWKALCLPASANHAR